jgi:endonuclease/exonuclease/phosphatase family metal-dependent hydrolase
VRLASYNVENLFQRARALSDGEAEIVEAHAEVNGLLSKSAYSDGDKRRIVELLRTLGVLNKDDAGKYAILRQNRGKLLRRPKHRTPEVAVAGRSDWVGWVDLKTAPVNELTTQHTAMVMRDTGADVLGVIEAENRIALRDFANVMLRAVNGKPYDHVMVIDGNDGRGIDVGILTRKGYEIASIVSHVDDGTRRSEIFSRDCPEYTVSTPQGNSVLIMVNHFKSKGYGDPKESDRRRRRQAERVAEIYTQRREEGQANVAVIGDLNDFPTSPPLRPLIRDTDLTDISQHPNFDDGGYPGTYGTATSPESKIDYILLSPALYENVTSGRMLRSGTWPGTRPRRWECYPTVTREEEQGSDHAAVIADLDV